MWVEYHNLAAHATALLPCTTVKKTTSQDMNTPGKPWSIQKPPTSTRWECINRPQLIEQSSCVPRKSARKTSPSSPINSGKREAVQRDHRKKIGSMRSQNSKIVR